MARQSIVAGFPFPLRISETNAQQSVAAGAIFVNATGAIHGALAQTEANDSISAAGGLVITAALAATEANDTISAAGALALSGLLAQTEADDSLDAAGAVFIAGALAQTDENDNLAAAASLDAVVTEGTGLAPWWHALLRQRLAIAEAAALAPRTASGVAAMGLVAGAGDAVFRFPRGGRARLLPIEGTGTADRGAAAAGTALAPVAAAGSAERGIVGRGHQQVVLTAAGRADTVAQAAGMGRVAAPEGFGRGIHLRTAAGTGRAAAFFGSGSADSARPSPVPARQPVSNDDDEVMLSITLLLAA